MACKYAKSTDEYHGWECSVTDGACMFVYPDSKRCAEEYGEGPDVEMEEMEKCSCHKLGKSLSSGMKCSNCGREL